MISILIMGIVYCIVNLIDGRKYVGVTRKTLKVRWKQHSYPHLCKPNSKSLLQRAIFEFGKENFVAFEIEVVNDGDFILHQRERHWIRVLDTNSKRGGHGYNRDEGGKGGPRDFSESTLQKLSNLCRLRMTGKKLTKSHKKAISKSQRGKSKSVETRQKMSESRPKKPIFQYDLTQKKMRFFECQQDAENFVRRNGWPKGGKNGIQDSIKFDVVRYASRWFTTNESFRHKFRDLFRFLPKLGHKEFCKIYVCQNSKNKI